MVTGMANELRPGQTRPGVLLDGQENTPVVVCNLTYEQGRGPLVEVAYIPGNPQFATAEVWIRDQTPPASLWFEDPEGSVTLTGLRWRGNRGTHVSVGRLDARVAILGRARELAPDYRIHSVTSQIDGLHEFAGFESISTQHDRVGGYTRTTVTLHAKDEVSLQHDGVTYRIHSTTPGSTSGRQVEVRADAVIETIKPDGATVEEHVEAQWPVRALLTLAFGTPLFWRGHQLLDDQFPTWMVGGRPRRPMHVPLLFERTVRDIEHPAADWRQLALAMFRLSDVGTQGLSHWLKLYADPLFSRAVEPTVEVINGGAGDFVEPRLALTMFALETLGYYLDEQRTPKGRLAHHIERCMDVPGVDWSELAKAQEIAHALANVSNDLKHPDRGRRPDGVEMSLAADLGVLILRLKFAHLLGVDDSVIQRFRTLVPFRTAITAFNRNGVSIRGGRLTREPRA